jgi:hypothetical protein
LRLPLGVLIDDVFGRKDIAKVELLSQRTTHCVEILGHDTTTTITIILGFHFWDSLHLGDQVLDLAIVLFLLEILRCVVILNLLISAQVRCMTSASTFLLFPRNLALDVATSSLLHIETLINGHEA